MLCGNISHSINFSSFRFLNFNIKKRQGKLTLNKDKICIIPHFLIEYTPEAIKNNRRKTVTEALGIFSGYICCSLFCLLMHHVADTLFFEMYTLTTSICFASNLFIFLKENIFDMGNSPKAVMKRKNKSILAFLKEGTPPSQLEDWLSEEIDFSYEPTFEQYMYIQFQYFCALEKSDKERICQLIYKIEKALPKKMPKSLGFVYNELIFYYSYLEKDLERAENYKKQAPHMIENDTDLNGRRVYAYYLYGKGANAYKILNVIEEGLSVAEEFPLRGNISMETNLLLRLKELQQLRLKNEMQ